MAKIKNIKVKESFGDRVLNLIIGIILVLFTITVAYPLIYVISCSFSSSRALEAGAVILWPVDVTLEAYEFVMAFKDVWTGFRNSVFYCIVDCIFQMSCTIMVAYPLSRSYLQGRTAYVYFFYILCRFGAGLIPSFILKCNLGLFDNIWAVLIGSIVATGQMLILRTAINTSIPAELHDATMMDGASHFQTVFKLVIPLTKATLSVLILYTLVGQWNEYFTSMIYLRRKELYPLQLILRPIMTAAAMTAVDQSSMASSYQQAADQGLENVRYALIIISSTPIIILYFFVQKYFKGGVMMGSVKG